MTHHFAHGMTKATELTRAGKLAEATSLIQSSLQDKAEAAIIQVDDTVIEGTFTRLDEPEAYEAVTAMPAQSNFAPRRSRASLGETLRSILSRAMPKHSAFAKGPAPVPAGAEFNLLIHVGQKGQRQYKLYVPATRPAEPTPLVVMLHGCTQSPDDFAAGTGMNTLAERDGFLVAYPAQPTGANAHKCWNWFRSEDQARDKGEPALIAGIVRDILQTYPVDPRRVYIAGLSAGGAAAAIVAAAYPDMFAAAGVHSGLAVGAAGDIPQAFAAMRGGATGQALKRAVPTIVVHGLADATVHPSNGTAVITQVLPSFGDLRRTVHKGQSSGGRAFRRTNHVGNDGRTMVEHWEVEGSGHAWAGGQPAGSFTDPTGPDVSNEMLRFFCQHTLR